MGGAGRGARLVLAGALLAGLWRFGDIVLLILAAVAAVLWVHLSAVAERTGTREGRALTVFGGTVALLLVLAAGRPRSAARSRTGCTGSASATSDRTAR